MKFPPRMILALLAVGCNSALLARPIDYKEISLLVRAHESESEIAQEVSQRRLARPLTAQQETILRGQGASDSLLRDLHNRDLLVSAADAADESERAAQSKTAAPAQDRETADNVRIFDVSLGHSINLSQWGGPDSEIQFNCRRFGGEDIIEPVAVSPYGNFIHTATYLGSAHFEDNTNVFDHRNYASVIAHSFVSPPLQIDWQHPVTIENTPYLLYPLCTTRGVSLYYIGAIGGSVRLATITN